MEPFKRFETERLLIRPTVVEDAPFVLELMNSPKWLQFIGDRNVKTLTDAQNYITTKMVPQLHKLGFSNYTVIRKMDNLKLGSCGLYDREGLDGIDLGFAFLPEHEGQGYAFEATKRLVQAAVHEFNLNCLSAITAKGNGASQRLLEKLEFRSTTTVILPNSTEELFLYSFERNP